MKELKDKEVIIGLIIIIILGAIALFLLIRREVNISKNEPIILEETYEQTETEVPEAVIPEQVIPKEDVIIMETEETAAAEDETENEKATGHHAWSRIGAGIDGWDECDGVCG